MTPEDKIIYEKLSPEEWRYLELHVVAVFWNGIPFSNRPQEMLDHLVSLGLLGECEGWHGDGHRAHQITCDGFAFMLRNWALMVDDLKRQYRPGGTVDTDKQYPRWRQAAHESLERRWARSNRLMQIVHT